VQGFDRFLERSRWQAASRIAGVYRGLIVEPERVAGTANALGLTPDLTFLGECDGIPACGSGWIADLSSDYEGFRTSFSRRWRLAAGHHQPAGEASLVVQHGKTGYVVDARIFKDGAFMVQLAGSPS